MKNSKATEATEATIEAVKAIFTVICNTVIYAPLDWFCANVMEDSQNLRIDTANNAENLTPSIILEGIKKPIEISLIDGFYIVCRGNCRTKAVKKIIADATPIKWNSVPVIIVERTADEHIKASALDFEQAGLSYAEQAKEVIRVYNALESEITEEKLILDQQVFRRWFSSADLNAEQRTQCLKGLKARKDKMHGFCQDTITLDCIQDSAFYADFMSKKPSVLRSDIKAIMPLKATCRLLKAEYETTDKSALARQAYINKLDTLINNAIAKVKAEKAETAAKKKAEKEGTTPTDTAEQTLKDGETTFSVTSQEIAFLLFIRKYKADIMTISVDIKAGKYTL